jgi:two-component sensor histidine kinase
MPPQLAFPRTGAMALKRKSTRFLEGGGAAGAAIRDFDWTSTSLGSVEAWPAALKTAVSIMLSSEFPMAVTWGEDLVMFHNDAFTPILGEKPPALGRPFRDVWSEAWHVIGPIADKAFAGEATFVEDFPLIVNRRGFPEQTYFTFSYSPIRDETGRVVGMLDTVVETTAKVQVERQARILNEELAHRLQNTIATVSALVDQTFRGGKSADEMHTTLLERIAALGRAHSILSASAWNGASIRSIVESALLPHVMHSGQVSVQGPELRLAAQHALCLALGLHELATNALRYGSLSEKAGHVSVCWEADHPDDQFRLTWTERNGPAVTLPQRRGFGSRLLEEVLAGEFDGKVEIRFEPKGLRFELTARMDTLA